MLTDEQRKTVEESMWVVDAVMHRLSIRDEDTKQELLYWLSWSIEKYDPQREVLWTTFAYTCVYRRALNIMRKKENPCLSYDGFFSIADTEDLYEKADENMDARRAFAMLNKEEQAVATCICDGMSMRETSAQTGYNLKKVFELWHIAKEKVRKYFDCNK